MGPEEKRRRTGTHEVPWHSSQGVLSSSSDGEVSETSADRASEPLDSLRRFGWSSSPPPPSAMPRLGHGQVRGALGSTSPSGLRWVVRGA